MTFIYILIPDSFCTHTHTRVCVSIFYKNRICMTICSLFSNQKSFCWKYQQDHKPWPKLVSSKREFHRTGNKKTRALLTWAADFTVSNAVFRTQFLFVCCPYALPHPHPGGWAELTPPLSVGLVAAGAAHSPHCHWFIYRSRGEYLTQSRWKVMNLLLGFLGRMSGLFLWDVKLRG